MGVRQDYAKAGWPLLVRKEETRVVQDLLPVIRFGRIAIAAFLMGGLIPTACVGAEDISEARAALKKRDYSDAAKKFRALAEEGNVDAQYQLGVLYSAGQGVPTNEGEAVGWFKRAAEAGNADAQWALAFRFFSQGLPTDVDAGIHWVKKAAGQGVPIAQTELGNVYFEGRGLAKDHAEAARWYQKAAEQGEWFGLHKMGWIRERGHGVTTDYVEAYKWYVLSVANGNDLARDDMKRLVPLLRPTNGEEEALRRAEPLAKRFGLNLSNALQEPKATCPEDTSGFAPYEAWDLQGFEVGLKWYSDIRTAEDRTAEESRDISFASLYEQSMWLMGKGKYKEALPLLKKLRWVAFRLAAPGLSQAKPEQTRPGCLPSFGNVWADRWWWVRHKYTIALHKIDSKKYPSLPKYDSSAVAVEIQDDKKEFETK